MGKLTKTVKKTKDKKEKILKLKKFDINFDDIKIEFPDDSYMELKISSQLLVNKDSPPDVLKRMADCGITYARWGIIEADLNAYHSLLTDRYYLFLSNAKQKVRKLLSGKASESLVTEKAILHNLDIYKDYRKKFHQVEKALHQIKRIMKALEIQSEMCRSISSFNKKEMSMTDNDPIIGKGSLKNLKGGK